VRAIAVASVVLFHVGFSDFSGGYSGVDIFFVLSGYLICGQAFLRIQDQSYSVTDFFARRIRRLSSAYFFCFLVTALVANALFLRSEMDEIFRNLLGSITFTNNFNLLNTQGYFNNDSEGNPFLHTWSLSIEEQFYIVLPLVILATRYSLAAFKTTIVVLFIVSMALMLFSGDLIYDREERFFATSFRVWELALGALVFLLVQHRGMLSAIPFAPILGMMLVLGPVFLLEKGVLYPGWVTLIPTFGVAVLIATCTPETSRTGRFLASRPMSYVGRISYGTYLWHWPLIVFVKYVGVDLSDASRAGLFFVSLALGALSYHLVEKPVRKIRIATGKPWLFGMFVAQTLILLGLLPYIYQQAQKSNGFEAEMLQKIEIQSEIYHPQWNSCWNQRTPDSFCRFGFEDASHTDFVLWGDSMANSAFWAFDEFAKETGQNGFLVTAPSCPPLLGMARDSSGADNCLKTNQAFLDYLSTSDPLTIYIFARWSYYSEGYSSHLSNAANEVGFIDDQGHLLPGDNFPVFRAAFEKTLETVQQRHRIVIVNQTPVFPYFVPKEMLKRLRFGGEPEPKTSQAFNARSGRTIAFIRELAARTSAGLVEPHMLMCGQGDCLMQQNGSPLFSDHVHLSRTGNALLQKMLILDNQ